MLRNQSDYNDNSLSVAACKQIINDDALLSLSSCLTFPAAAGITYYSTASAALLVCNNNHDDNKTTCAEDNDNKWNERGMLSVTWSAKFTSSLLSPTNSHLHLLLFIYCYSFSLRNVIGAVIKYAAGRTYGHTDKYATLWSSVIDKEKQHNLAAIMQSHNLLCFCLKTIMIICSIYFSSDYCCCCCCPFCFLQIASLLSHYNVFWKIV